jgi:hypothetical protein
VTTDPSAGDKPATELTKPLRLPAALAMLGVNALWLLISIQRYLLPDAEVAFSARSIEAFTAFTAVAQPPTLLLPLLAVLLATHIAPALAQSKLIVLAALGEYAVCALFGGISFLGALFYDGIGVRSGFEGFFFRTGSLVLLALAALVVVKVALPMLQGPPKPDRLAAYGRQGQSAPAQGYDAYGAPQQGQAGYAAQGTQYPGYPPQQYPEQQPYQQQFPPQQYGASDSTQIYQGGSYPATSQVYGTPTSGSGSTPSSGGPSAAQPYSGAPSSGATSGAQPYSGAPAGGGLGWDGHPSPPSYEPQPSVYPYDPPQAPSGWSGQPQPPQPPQPPAGNVYGSSGAWPPAGQPDQPAGNRTDEEIQKTQLMSPEEQRAEEARQRAAQERGEGWFDQR